MIPAAHGHEDRPQVSPGPVTFPLEHFRRPRHVLVRIANCYMAAMRLRRPRASRACSLLVKKVVKPARLSGRGPSVGWIPQDEIPPFSSITNLQHDDDSVISRESPGQIPIHVAGLWNRTRAFERPNIWKCFHCWLCRVGVDRPDSSSTLPRHGTASRGPVQATPRRTRNQLHATLPSIRLPTCCGEP